MKDEYYINLLKEKIQDKNISSSQKAYYERILRVYNMPDLSKINGNPVNIVVEKITKSDYFKDFEIFSSPEIVKEFETFDLFYFPENHVARRPSDSYFIEKTPHKENNVLLRPHTTTLWYHYLIGKKIGKTRLLLSKLKNSFTVPLYSSLKFLNFSSKILPFGDFLDENISGLEKLKKTGEIKVLSYGKVYRVDELDKTHHECFHQIDGLKITEKSKEIISENTLKEVLSNTIKALFGEIEFRFNRDSFPYTTDSLEVEVMYNGKWLEVLGAGVVKGEVLEKLGVDSSKYNGWAFGFGIERLAMALKKIPDIRIFWSLDKRVLSQWGNLEPYEEISHFPPVYKDISLIVPKESFKFDENEKELKLTRETESSLFAITGIIRDIGKDLIEEVKIIDNFENDKKFGEKYKSISLNITFRSIERTLINDEINEMYFQIREKIEKDLGYILR